MTIKNMIIKIEKNADRKIETTASTRNSKLNIFIDSNKTMWHILVPRSENLKIINKNKTSSITHTEYNS